MHKFGVLTNKIIYSAKKVPLQQLELRINFKELFCYLQPRIIQSILFWKRKRKNETKYFLLEFIVIAIPNRLLYFSFNSQCASAFFPEWKSLNHTHCSITLQFFTPYILHLQNTYFSKVLAQKTKALSVEPEQWKDTPSTCIHTYYTVVTP